MKRKTKETMNYDPSIYAYFGGAYQTLWGQLYAGWKVTPADCSLSRGKSYCENKINKKDNEKDKSEKR